LKIIISESEEGQRVDFALAELAGISRSQAQRWIESDLVRINGRSPRASRRVRCGDSLEATPAEPAPSSVAPEAIPLSVLYEDDDLIVIDKPAGLVVHPAPGHPGGTLVNALLHHCGDLAGVGGVLRPGIVHRLDQGTSGVMVAAKNDVAHRVLSEQFRDHSIEREYRALVRALPGADTGRVDQPIGRHPRDRKRMSVRSHRGREASTVWRVLRRFRVSGRTHQIRVHLAAAGMPVVSDPVYGRSRREPLALDHPALHASTLGFDHPRLGERLRFEAPLPDDLAQLIASLEAREEGA